MQQALLEQISEELQRTVDPCGLKRRKLDEELADTSCDDMAARSRKIAYFKASQLLIWSILCKNPF